MNRLLRVMIGIGIYLVSLMVAFFSYEQAASLFLGRVSMPCFLARILCFLVIFIGGSLLLRLLGSILWRSGEASLGWLVRVPGLALRAVILGILFYTLIFVATELFPRGKNILEKVKKSAGGGKRVGEVIPPRVKEQAFIGSLSFLSPDVIGDCKGKWDKEIQRHLSAAAQRYDELVADYIFDVTILSKQLEFNQAKEQALKEAVKERGEFLAKSTEEVFQRYRQLKERFSASSSFRLEENSRMLYEDYEALKDRVVRELNLARDDLVHVRKRIADLEESIKIRELRKRLAEFDFSSPVAGLSKAAQRPNKVSSLPKDISQTASMYAKKYDIDPALALAVIKAESDFQPYTVSHAGAKGLMQLRDGTAKDMGVRDIYDIDENIEGGIKYLRYLLDRYDGNLELALAAYNAGPENVSKYGGMPPFQETRDYVPKVIKFYKFYKTRDMNLS